jgi:hypothetical protein
MPDMAGWLVCGGYVRGRAEGYATVCSKKEAERRGRRSPLTLESAADALINLTGLFLQLAERAEKDKDVPLWPSIRS